MDIRNQLLAGVAERADSQEICDAVGEAVTLIADAMAPGGEGVIAANDIGWHLRNMTLTVAADGPAAIDEMARALASELARLGPARVARIPQLQLLLVSDNAFRSLRSWAWPMPFDTTIDHCETVLDGYLDADDASMWAEDGFVDRAFVSSLLRLGALRLIDSQAHIATWLGAPVALAAQRDRAQEREVIAQAQVIGCLIAFLGATRSQLPWLAEAVAAEQRAIESDLGPFMASLTPRIRQLWDGFSRALAAPAKAEVDGPAQA